MAKQKVDIQISAVDAASGVFARVTRSLDKLKQSAGSRGPFKDIAELAVGGGAIAGLQFGANLLQRMGDEAVRLRDEFNAGKIGVQDLVAELARGVPIVGSLARGFDAVRELFTGELAAARRLTEEAERTNKIIELRNAAMKQQKEFAEQNARTLLELQTKAEMIGGTAFQKAFAGVALGATLERGATAKSFKEQIDKAKADSDALLKTIAAEIDAKRAAVPGPFKLGVRDAIHMSDAEEAAARAKRNQEITAAQAEVTAALNRETAERERVAKQIAQIERDKYEALQLIGRNAFGEMNEMAMAEQERQGREAAEAQKKRQDEQIRIMREGTKKFLEAKAQEQAAFLNSFGNLDDEGGSGLDPAGGELLRRFQRQNIEKKLGIGRGGTTATRTADVIASRFVAGSVGDPDMQLRRQQNELTRTTNDRLEKVARGLLDFTNELRRRGAGGFAGPDIGAF